MPLFFSDFLGATAEWTGEERALYLLLLGYQWTLGSLPSDWRRLVMLVGWLEENFKECWPTVSRKFEERDGRLYNRRLEEHRAKAKAISAKNAAAGKKGAEARWGCDDERQDERHSDSDGERYQDATGERHARADGATNGNPNHPTPTHPKCSVETVELEVGGVGEKPYDRCDVTQRSDSPSLQPPEFPKFNRRTTKGRRNANGATVR
jgi:uncharacterized protein YdaU (DUF1376 family)